MYFVLSHLIIMECLRRHNINFVAQIIQLWAEDSERLRSLLIVTDLVSGQDEIWTKSDAEPVPISPHRAAHNYKYHLLSAEHPMKWRQ